MTEPPFVTPDPHTSRPTLQGTFGMSASTHWTATATAQSVLERGGNAVDAAVAAGFALHLVEPHLNGPGGDMVALLAPAGGGPRVVVGQGPAPAGATATHLRAEGLDRVPGAGALAAAVPGSVEAWLWMLREHGSWELADVLAPAIDLAEDGAPVVPALAATVAGMAEHFRAHWPTSYAQWLPDGRPPEAGGLVTNPAYARTLRRLLAVGEGAADRVARIDAAGEAWREGFVAEALEAAAAVPHRHSTGGTHAGVLTRADTAAFRVTTETPLAVDFRGTTVLKAGPWSQGPVLPMALGVLDALDRAHGGDGRAIDPSTELGAHHVLEALVLAMADRDAYLGRRTDPALLAHLLSPAYAEQRAAQVGDRAARALRPGVVPGAEPWTPPLVTADELEASGSDLGPGTGEPTVRTPVARGDTCHVDVVDRWGTLVSATPSGGWLQSSPTVPELGFCLGTRLQMTWLDDDSPSALVPGHRPRTTLSPTMLAVDGTVTTALGTPGGDQQDQWQLLYVLRTVVGGYSPQQAIDAPAFHTTGFPGSFWPRTWTPGGVVAEDRLGADVVAGLRRRGHDVRTVGPWALGRLSSVSRDPATGRLQAAANSRGAQGYAAGR